MLTGSSDKIPSLLDIPRHIPDSLPAVPRTADNVHCHAINKSSAAARSVGPKTRRCFHSSVHINFLLIQGDGL